MTGCSVTPRSSVVAVQVAERVARAQDMLARVGVRSVYESNYAIEKLADAARCSLEACVLMGMDEREIERLVDAALKRADGLRAGLGEQDRRCERCG